LSDAFPAVRRGLPVRYSGSAQIEANAHQQPFSLAHPSNRTIPEFALPPRPLTCAFRRRIDVLESELKTMAAGFATTSPRSSVLLTDRQTKPMMMSALGQKQTFSRV
jgi:hypothetical protein